LALSTKGKGGAQILFGAGGKAISKGDGQFHFGGKERGRGKLSHQGVLHGALG